MKTERSEHIDQSNLIMPWRFHWGGKIHHQSPDPAKNTGFFHRGGSSTVAPAADLLRCAVLSPVAKKAAKGIGRPICTEGSVGQ